MGLIGVRWHAFVGAALLAVTVPLAMLAALRIGPLPRDLHLSAALGGFTLLAQAIAYWYLPSFTKREVVLDGLASYSGPLLFPLGVIAAALGVPALRVAMPALGLAIFGLILILTPVAGARWRSGIPFWRTLGPFRTGDLAAMLALALAGLGAIGAGVIGFLMPSLFAWAWPAVIGAFALGALAHLVPRSRGRPILVAPFLFAVVCYHMGALIVLATRTGRAFGSTALGEVLLVGFPLAIYAISPSRASKRAGPRFQEARLPLLGSLATAIIAVGLGLSGRSLGLTFSAYYAFLACVGLALAAVAHLTLPVVFNRPPARAFVAPAALAAVLGAGLLAAGFLTRLPRWPGAALLVGAILLWLAALAPLRRPRRDCPPSWRQPS